MGTNDQQGFTLVEAMLACALLVIVLVPALSAFRAQIAATTRRARDLSTSIALDDLAGRVEYEVSMTNSPSATSERRSFSLLSLSDPEEICPPVDTASLLRFTLSSLPLEKKSAPVVRVPLYVIAPIATNEAPR